jgi:hypothetical protein
MRRFYPGPNIVGTILLAGATFVSAAQYDTTLYNSSFSCVGGDCGEWDTPMYWAITKGAGKDSTVAFRDTDPANYQTAPRAQDGHGPRRGLTPEGNPKDVHVAQNLVRTGEAGLGYGTPSAPGTEYTYGFWIKVDSLAPGGAIHVVCHHSEGESWTEDFWQSLYLGRGPTGDWLHITGTKTTPETAWWSVLRLYTNGGGAAWHVDDIMLNGQHEVMDAASPPNPDCCNPTAVAPTDYHQAMLTFTAETRTSDVPRVLCPDGRVVNTAKLPSVVSGRGLAPGCYIVTRRSADGLLSERVLTK